MKRLIVAGLALLLVACGSKPSEDVIQAQLLQYLGESGHGAIYEVIQFEKVNGIPRDDNTYFVDVRYRIAFKVDLVDAPRALQKGSGSIFSAGVEAANLGVEFGNFREGDEKLVEQRLKFIRTERGWMLESEKPRGR